VCPYFSHEAPLENQLTLGNALTYPKWLGVVLHQMSIVITIKTFDLGQVPLYLFDWQLFACRLLLVILRHWLTLTPFSFVATLAPTAWADLIFWVTPLSVSPLGQIKASSSIHTTIFINPWHIYGISILW
jgi:hypothetical protein